MPVFMRDEVTGPMAWQRVNIITQDLVSGYGLGQSRGWGLSALGFANKHITYTQTNTTDLDPTQ
jgi:hypothetical protein